MTSATTTSVLSWPSFEAASTSTSAHVPALPRYAGWSILLGEQLANLKPIAGEPPPSARALTDAWTVLDSLVEADLRPTRVTTSAEGGIAFIFERGGKYADIECLNNGCVLAGFTDFADRREVLDFDPDRREIWSNACLELASFLDA